ncbi:MAG: hypothetical protein COA78_17305 [Blastopirellula sp.]|nr:MAG: hypothetical protein COA78_17305 [Blastopirellula sp.]
MKNSANNFFDELASLPEWTRQKGFASLMWHDTTWWQFQPASLNEGRCYCQLEVEFNQIMIRVIYTEEEYSGKGVATKAIESLKGLIDELDRVAKTEGTYLILKLCPSPVDICGLIPREDWRSGFEIGFSVKLDTKRLDLDALINWYTKKLGFVPCECLRYRREGNCMVPNMTYGSWILKRPALMYPEENLDFVEAEYQGLAFKGFVV